METWVEEKLRQGHQICICQPVYFEVMRDLLWKNLTAKLTILRSKVMPKLEIAAIEDGDWLQAAQFWASAVSRGRQINDIDLFVAAIAHRLDAIIVSSDTDFDALPVKREDWRV